VLVVAALLSGTLLTAFGNNPLLNSLILFVLLLGIIWNIRQVTRLTREVTWLETFQKSRARLAATPAPRLLAPMASMLASRTGKGRDGQDRFTISAASMRSLLDTIASRLDESRELSRYMTGLLIFLGLLGTFWGLLETVHSISGVIESMKTGSDTATMFDDLKSGLSAPIAGMSVSFTSSLFGLAGSLILGFLDLQAGQAQNRFYTELEDFLASHIETESAPASTAVADTSEQRRSATAMANLAEGIQALVGHMRQEQQMIRDWVDVQNRQQEEIRKLLRLLVDEREDHV
jgi:hypothetical protein